MAIVPSYFDEFLSNINPSKSYLEDQKSGHTTLRRRLEDDEDFGGYHIATFLQGSYARKTAVHPGKDVDVVVVTNLEPSVSPSDANALMERFLNRHYKGKWQRQNRSYGIELSYVTLDVVFAITRHLPSSERTQLMNSYSFLDTSVDWQKYPLLIPDRALGRWVETHPKAQMEATTRINKASGGYFVPLVKAFKWWRKQAYQQPKYPKGYILERLIAEVVDVRKTSHAEHLVAAFEGIVANYATNAAFGLVPSLPDFGNSSHNVAGRLAAEDFKAFYEKVTLALPLARQALAETDVARSVVLWRKLLGDEFPKSPDRVTDASFPSKPIALNKPAGFA